MNRSDFLRISALAGISLPLLGANATANPALKEIRGGVGTFSLRGGTVGWFRSDDYNVMVDTQFADSAAQFLIEFLGKHQQLHYVVNTHHHGDHTGGNKVVQARSKNIIAHKNVPKLQEMAAKARNTLDDQVYADVTYSDNFTLSLGSEKLTLRYFGNAHTSGDSLVHFENANVAHVGDLIFHKMPAFVDRSAGANVENWIVVLEKIFHHLDSDTKIIFGHANDGFEVVGNRLDLSHKQAFLSACLDYSRAGIKAGKSKDELTNVPYIPGFEEHESKSWAAGMKNMLSAVYDEVEESN